MRLTLETGWQVLQDVHGSAERLGLPRAEIAQDAWGAELSEWEPIDRLVHLQVLFASTPYWGRELRHFNQAPWWYRNEFEVPEGELGALTFLRFSNVDYYAKVWLNGELLGEHEGYSAPFEFDVSSLVLPGTNALVVKVSSPWDDDVKDGNDGWRIQSIRREMVKGTYEHDDGFIQRDVNPVGIYGTVTLSSYPDHRVRRPEVRSEVDRKRHRAKVRVSGVVDSAAAPPGEVRIEIGRSRSDAIVSVVPVSRDGSYAAVVDVPDAVFWETWDRGTPELYTVRVSAPGDAAEIRTGFREISMTRTPDETTLALNGRRLFVRGASYFPDVYLSQMDVDRYRRHLEAAKRAGINMLRVHVHTERPEFYELCDEYGIGVMQDSEFNWMHPDSDEWTARMVAIYSETIGMLIHHPSMMVWACMNEPAPGDSVSYDRFMNVRPGPQLAAAVRELDPSRPLIKGSGAAEDPDAGDSHNYLGSLSGVATAYTDIDGSEEYFNTEFGFDAPGSIANLAGTGKLFRRLERLVPIIPDIQHYQYRLLKYYIEHYRVQRFDPCSGYMQFMFSDIGPNSFYGVYDWWGDPKPGYEALLESNQPLAVILEQTATRSSTIWFVNDTLADLGPVEVAWKATGARGSVIAEGARTKTVRADSLVEVAPLDLSADLGHVDLELTATVDGRVVATNRYRGLFDHPTHPAGHPSRLSHEYGVRLYSA